MHNHTILAVNDDADQLALLAFIFGEVGYLVLISDSAAEGLEIARRESIDLIISDVMMPEMDGIEFCRRIRADRQLSSIPFLLVSALRKDTSSVVEGLEAGADDYIEAPFESLRLVAKATQLIERGRMNAALLASEHRFRMLIENVSDIVSILASDGTIIYESPSLENILGYRPDEIIGQNGFDFVHSDDTEKVIEYFNLSIGNFAAPTTVEYRFRHKDGSWRILESVGKPFSNTKNELNLIVTSRDTTGRKRAEEALRASREHLELAQQAGKIGSFELDFKTGVAVASSEMKRLYGVSSANTDGKLESWGEDWSKFVHPDDAQKVEQSLANALQTGVLDSEYRIVRGDGVTRWIQANGKIFYDDEGAPVRVVGVNTDITERKEAELTLNFQKSLLAAQSEATIDGVLVVSPSDEILSLNRRFAEMWEISEDVLAANSDRKIIESVIEELSEPQKFVDNIEYLHKHPHVRDQVEINLKDGRIFEWHTAPVTNSDDVYFGRIRSFRDITERRQAEETLRESEKRYRLLFEANPLPMWVYDVETFRFLAVNAAAVFHYGYTREEFLSMTIKDIRPPEDIAALVENVSQLSGGIDHADFWRHIKKNGDVIDVEITSHELIFDGRRAELVLAVDVTERKKAEESVRFQAHLLDTVEQAVVATDLTGTVVYWNQFAEKLYGWTKAEAVGRKTAELTTPETSFQQASEIMAQLRAGKSWSGEFSVRNKNGVIFPACVFDSPVNDDNGNLIGIVGISTDITERKKAEEALRQTEARYRNLIELSPAIVYLAEPLPPYAPIYVSPNVEIFGYQSAEWFSRPDMWLSLIHEEDRERVLGITENAMKIGIDTEIEYRIVGRGGDIFWVHDKGCFIADEAGNKIGWQGVILDVTDTKKLEEQLRQSQKLESVGKLAGGIAHDFNNMLTAINGYSDLTLRRLSADDPLRGNIEEIKKAGERSAALTHQLLAFSRKQVLKPKILNLNEVIIDTSKMLNRLIGEHIHLELVPESNLGMVEADPGQLTQVIMNLAVNARDAMPAGGNLTIETANVYLDEEYAESHFPTRVGSYVLVAVTDTGTGIDEDTKKHIFEPFYTTKNVGAGTGLGLATVYGIIKQSEGFIWVDSEIGKGASFKIYLPRVEEISEAAIEENKSSEPTRTGTETILLVEDEDIVRKMSRKMLEACGYRVFEARNGVEALSICESRFGQIDLLLTDVVMPQMSGRQLAEKIAETQPHIRLLYMSGYTDDQIIRQGTITEDKNFIQKPFTFEALTNKLREVLD